MAVDPTNEFGLISARDAFTSATTLPSSASFIFNVSPSRDLTVITVPSTCSTVPRTRIGLSCANAAAEANRTAHVAPIIVKVFTAFSLNDCATRSCGAVTVKKRYRPASHCGRQVAADIERLGKNRAVRLLVGCHDDDLRARLEFILVARRDRGDRCCRRDDNFLFAFLEFHHDRLTILFKIRFRLRAAGFGSQIETQIGRAALLGGKKGVTKNPCDSPGGPGNPGE